MASLASGSTLAELEEDLEARLPAAGKSVSRRGAKGGASNKKSPEAASVSSSPPVARKKRARPQELDAESDATDTNDSGSDSESTSSELNTFFYIFRKDF